MIKKFLYLEWKSFVRSASFATNLFIKILMGLGALYFIAMFAIMGAGGFYFLKEGLKLDPLATVNRYLIYYFVLDLCIRLIFQKMPVLNIRPMLILPIRRETIVHFSLGKTFLSFFNIIHIFFFLPFTIVLLIEGYAPEKVLCWFLGIWALTYINNLLNLLLNNKDGLFYIFLVLIAGLGALQYYDYFDITNYTVHFYQGIFDIAGLAVLPILVFLGLYYITFKYLRSELYLDAGLASKQVIANSENFNWLNQFGSLGTFLKNDIRLIKRNKRAKGTITASIMFLFYGLLFFTGAVEAYDNPFMYMFAGIFISGGFLFTFGQFVPSWDSAYYPLMMTQNVPYKMYLTSKWWLMVIAVCVSVVLSSFYIYFGWNIYRMILVAAVYNIGVNSHLVLLGGAYTKTPIDLASAKGAFGQKKAFNVKVMLISLPKILLPALLYGLGILINETTALLFVLGVGLLGFAFRDKAFSMIVNIYKKEKYSTLDAYKQKN